MKEGFVTDDGYAAVPFGKKLMIIYNGKQIDVVNTPLQAKKYIDKMRSDPKIGTIFVK
jgi:hypothetical protein